MMLSALRGHTVRGPMAGREQAFVLVRDWLGPVDRVDRDRALAELARRFLAGHGPASDRDLARWAGLPLRDVRTGLSAIASEIEVRDDGLVDLAGRPAPAAIPGPKLLGAFEPVLMGWTSREPILAGHTRLVTSNGVFRPFVLVNGRAVGTWRFQGGAVSLELFAEVSARAARVLEREAADVKRFLARQPSQRRRKASVRRSAARPWAPGHEWLPCGYTYSDVGTRWATSARCSARASASGTASVVPADSTSVGGRRPAPASTGPKAPPE
jgi:hypothetical protein